MFRIGVRSTHHISDPACGMHYDHGVYPYDAQYPNPFHPRNRNTHNTVRLPWTSQAISPNGGITKDAQHRTLALWGMHRQVH